MQSYTRVLVVDIPALGEDAFGVELRIELDQSVPHRVDRALAVQEVAVERREVAQIALAQDAAGARLLGRSGIRRNRPGARRGWRRRGATRRARLARRQNCHTGRDAEQLQGAP